MSYKRLYQLSPTTIYFTNLAKQLKRELLANQIKNKHKIMEIISLDKVPLSKITICFNHAFSDYFVKFNATECYLKRRWKGAGVDLSLSSGVLDKGKLVGFIIIGIRNWKGLKTAFNSGTGVIPSHRGNALTEKMYEFLLPKFKTKNIRCLSLEVIQENIKAVHIYEKVGLKIHRGLHCYGGEVKVEIPKLENGIEFFEMKNPTINVFKSFYDFEPAWENNNQSVQENIEDYKFYGVKNKESLLAFAIIKSENGCLSQFGVHPDHRQKGIGKFLFGHLSKVYPTMKTNNVDASAIHVLKFLEDLGMKNTVNQYEMVSYL